MAYRPQPTLSVLRRRSVWLRGSDVRLKKDCESQELTKSALRAKRTTVSKFKELGVENPDEDAVLEAISMRRKSASLKSVMEEAGRTYGELFNAFVELKTDALQEKLKQDATAISTL